MLRCLLSQLVVLHVLLAVMFVQCSPSQLCMLVCSLYRCCVQCYADMGEHEVVQLVDCTLRKSDLVKKKNDEVSAPVTAVTSAQQTYTVAMIASAAVAATADNSLKALVSVQCFACGF
jgi:hypothetical protein